MKFFFSYQLLVSTIKRNFWQSLKKLCRYGAEPPFREICRLRADPLFSYSPSRAEREKQAARKLVSRVWACLRERRKKRDYRQNLSVWPFALLPQRKNCDWLMLGALTTRCQHSLICALQSITCHGWRIAGMFISVSKNRLAETRAKTSRGSSTRWPRCPGFVCSPFFFAFRADTPRHETRAFVRPTFARPVFFAPLSTDCKKTKGLLVV